MGFQEVARRGLLARSAAGPSNAHEMPGIIGNEMSVDIAAALRHEAKTAQAVAERQTNRQDKAVLQQLAAKLVEIAERLERDARD